MVTWNWKRVSVGAVSAGVLVVGAVAAAGGADAAGLNRRPVCNSLFFTMPAAVGGQVRVPVLDVAADPDLTQVRLVSVFGGAPMGTVVISDSGTPGVPGDDALVFTRTNPGTGTAYLYWTVSDGTLSAQCTSVADNEPPPDNG